MQRVLNPASVVSKYYGNLAPMTVHHLSALINDQKTLVSSYVSRCLFDKISYDELQGIYKVMDSPCYLVLNGIFFELLFLFKIKAICEQLKRDVQPKKNNLQLYGDDGKVEQWTVTSWREFNPTAIEKQRNEDWLIPQKWNQALFDCIQLNPSTLE